MAWPVGWLLLALLVALGLLPQFRLKGVEPGAVAAMPAHPPRPKREAHRSNPVEAPALVSPSIISIAEKSMRVEKIKRDYADIRNKVTADYSAAGNAFPGGLPAYLRQIALLEQEKRADLARALTPRELEDLEMRETPAGQMTERLLAATGATEEQRRAVFRMQQRYDDRFALVFDVTPRALFERESARQQVQEQIHDVLGSDLFAAWLAEEGDEYRQVAAFAARNGLPVTVPIELRRIQNEFALRRLELNAGPNLPAEQSRAALLALAQQMEARVTAIVGAGPLQAARGDLLSWLPKR